MDGINRATGANGQLAAVGLGCGDRKAAERIVQDAHAAAQSQITERRAEAAKPALPQTALDRLLSTPGPLDRFAGGHRADRA
ncbi:hypothetical protein J2Y58_000533 [Sphingomonas sp. BE138]|uniref:hypothetical protein n=1 Tax=Sphingomonas sp. BE138 TaxID=2817845 RepID=UPI002859F4E3|nr:hypothetical protein [Sphingomonas sp. BE138]MDR6787195.1 hypothetical protein [Sphingomonas sp. BE138]